MTDLDDLVASSVREIAGEADAKVRRVDLSTVLAEGSRRSRRRRKRRQAVATGALIAAVVLVFIVPLPHLLLRHQTASTTVPTVPNAHRVRKSSASVSVAEILAGRWSTMPPAPITARGDAAVVWTGRELIVWGGSAGSHGAHLYGDGAAYDPSTKSWQVLPPAPLPPTAAASAVWAGSEMVVFGGYDDESLGAFHVTNAAAAYNPLTNSWRRLPPAPLSPRAGAISLWTGKKVIVLGGQPAVITATLQSYGDGAVFDPTNDTWQHLRAPVRPRGHRLAWLTAVQTGNKLLALSRWAENRSLGHGTIEESFGADLFDYDLTSGSWSLVPARPDALRGPEEALWTGHLLVVRGSDCGFSCPETFASGVTDLYDPSGNTWTRISADPLGTVDTSAWTGDALFSFNPGTESGSIRPGAASLYDPSTHRWSLLPTAPFGCSSGQPVWTDRQILIYCPQFGAGAPKAAGLAYTPHLVSSAAPVEIQLVLDRTRVTAGTPIRGEALLTNTTGKTITVQTCAADGWLSVGLTNAQVSYDPATMGVDCAPTVRVSPGLNRFPIVISSSFLACTQASSQATPQLPVCTSKGEPPLPAGQYLTKIITTGLPAGTRLPSAMKVTLLATATTFSP